MPIRLWTGSEWRDGQIVVSTGGSDFKTGSVRLWPWTGGTDFISGLRYPILAAEGFGSGEWNGHTTFAADRLFTKDSIATLQPYRLVGSCNVYKLSGETGADSLVLSGSAPGVASAAEWAALTVPSPVTGGLAQPASFWDNAAHQSVSVAPKWLNSRIIIARAMSADAATALRDWVVANNAEGAVIITSSTYSTCVTLAATPGLNVIYEVASGYPGDGTVSSPETISAAGIYGVSMPAGNVTGTISNGVRLAGLRMYAYSVASTATASSLANLGVEGLFTTLPSTVGSVALPPNPDPTPVDPGPGDPPANIGTWWGWNTQGASISSVVNSGLTEVGLVRWFYGTSPFNLSSVDSLSQATGVWISFKPSAQDMESQPSAVNAKTISLLKAAYGKNKPIFIAYHHEPESSPENKPSTWTWDRWGDVWRNCHGDLYAKCEAENANGYQFYVAPIVCDWNFINNKTGGMDQWYPSDGSWLDFHVMGFDCYPTGQSMDHNLEQRICRLRTDGPYLPAPYVYQEGDRIEKRMPGKSGTDPRHDSYGYIIKCAALAKKLNKPWGSAECGINPSSLYGGDSFEPFTHAQRAQRFWDIYNHCLSLENPPRLWTWWKQDTPAEIDEIFNHSVASNPTSPPRP